MPLYPVGTHLLCRCSITGHSAHGDEIVIVEGTHNDTEETLENMRTRLFAGPLQLATRTLNAPHHGKWWHDTEKAQLIMPTRKELTQRVKYSSKRVCYEFDADIKPLD